MIDNNIPLTEKWLEEVGFYRKPREQRQPFDHWKIEIRQKCDFGMYIETTKLG